MRGTWLPGLLVGLTAGVITLVGPTLGWLLMAAFALPALLGRHRLPAFGGLLTGIGAIWLVLLGRMAIACPVRDPSELGCHAPGLDPWLTAGGVMLAAGLAVSALAFGRRRRRGP
jgi:hypothetical protein